MVELGSEDLLVLLLASSTIFKEVRRPLSQGLLPGMDLLGWTSNRLASSAIVCSPWSAAKATLALKTGLCFLHVCFMSCSLFKADLQGFVLESTEDGSVVYTDEAKAYKGMPHRSHWAINHGAGEYVKRQTSTNGIESFWALMKRGLHGTYHHVSVKHLGRYVTEFSGRHNDRPSDTEAQMRHMVRGMVGKRLTYKDLTG